LQQFIGIFKNIAQFVAAGAQHLGRQLRRHLDSGHGTVFRNKPNLVDPDTRVSRHGRLQLFRQLAGFCVAAWKRAHKTRELRLRQIFREVNAGDSGSRQQLRKTPLARGRSQRHAVQQDLRS
jgi:hypothetical protein